MKFNRLKFDLDEKDYLQIWLPEFHIEQYPELEQGLYEMANSARLKDADRAFDSIMIDDFSKSYQDVLKEVKLKEPAISQENYDAPDLNLHAVQLSRVLTEIYENFSKLDESKQEAEIYF